MKSRELIEKICAHQDSRCFTLNGTDDEKELKEKLEVVFDNPAFVDFKENIQADFFFVSQGQFLSADLMRSWDALVVDKNERGTFVYYIYAIKD